MHTQTDDAFVLGRLFSVSRLALVAESPASTTLPENVIYNNMKKMAKLLKVSERVQRYVTLWKSHFNK